MLLASSGVNDSLTKIFKFEPGLACCCLRVNVDSRWTWLRKSRALLADATKI